jgi:glutamine phosphoribosylpyrophosphate amidotransferase
MVLEYHHVKPGKGGAFVRTKMKNLLTGLVREELFRSGEKFPSPDLEYKQMQGNMGVGVISDRDPQPLIIGSRFGTFAIVIAGLIENIDALSADLLREGHSFGEMSSGGLSSVELVAKLINTGKDIVDGIEKCSTRSKALPPSSC